MKIAVTGATGFLGCHVCKNLRDLGHQTIEFNSKNLDIRNSVELPQADVLVHIAANPKVYLARKEVFEDFKINALGTLHVLEAMRNAGIGKIVYISSSRVYRCQANSREEDPVGASSNGGPYGASKLVGELYVQQYSDCYEMKYVILRLSSLYGPLMYKNAIIDMIKGFMSNETIKLYHHIDSQIDFIYVKDAAEGISRSLEWENQILNLSAGIGTKLTHVYGALKTIFAKEVPLEYSDELICITPSNERIKKLGWEPKYSIDKGLRETVEFFLTASREACCGQEASSVTYSRKRENPGGSS
jgi:UDP-glucose 4-epimerase